jgi:DNA-binding MarR family transcriptional regulator
MDEDRQTLIDAVRTAAHRSKRAANALDDAIAERFGINRTDLRHLDLLCDGPLSAGQLSERSGLSPAAMTTLIDRLERKGYVRRIRDLNDRRRVFVELTDQARKAAWEVYGPLAQDANELLGDYTDDQLSAMCDLLRADSELHQRHHQRVKTDPTLTS